MQFWTPSAYPKASQASEEMVMVTGNSEGEGEGGDCNGEGEGGDCNRGDGCGIADYSLKGLVSIAYRCERETRRESSA